MGTTKWTQKNDRNKCRQISSIPNRIYLWKNFADVVWKIFKIIQKKVREL